MRRFLLICSTFLFLLFISCIPYKIAPKIQDYKIVLAKKFKKDLPRNYAFVFEDKKEANEFYHYVNAKYDLAFNDVESNVPLQIDQQTFYMSFYEREKTTEKVNIIPMAIDGLLHSEGYDPILSEAHGSRDGYWYIIIVVTDSQMKDALAPSYEFSAQIEKYLDNMRIEYFNTHHYSELSFRK